VRYGEGAAAEIRRGTTHYVAQMKGLGLSESALAELVEAYLPLIAEFDADHVDEMGGIAEGADLPFPSIVLMNARTELLKLAGQPMLRAGLLAERSSEGCTTIIVQPERAPDNVLIHAHNWDWKASCADACIVLRIRQENGPDILTFTEAGGLARFGFNSVGVAITGNYLECERDYRRLGVPLALIRRKVLENEHLALAMRAVYCTQKSAANNMIVSHCEGVAIDFECAPDETFQVHPDRGLLVHANHFVSPVALGKLKDTGILNTPDSLYRDVRVRGILEPQIGAITLDAVKEALFDDFATPWAVCRPPRRNLSNNLSATVAMILMEPERGVMEVAPLPALNRQFTTYTLDMAMAARTSADPQAIAKAV
jgi:isopenicillin-N N-acyltransferase-like protein